MIGHKNVRQCMVRIEINSDKFIKNGYFMLIVQTGLQLQDTKRSEYFVDDVLLDENWRASDWLAGSKTSKYH